MNVVSKQTNLATKLLNLVCDKVNRFYAKRKTIWNKATWFSSLKIRETVKIQNLWFTTSYVFSTSIHTDLRRKHLHWEAQYFPACINHCGLLDHLARAVHISLRLIDASLNVILEFQKESSIVYLMGEGKSMVRGWK